jgi:hypothetical protein
VFLLVLAVPALLVVVLGYSLGYGVWNAVIGAAGAEPAGWLTGLVLLIATVWLAAVLWRRRGRPRRRR